MISLSWNQINVWRLSQHNLLERTTPDKLLEVVSKIGGLHAQMMSAAELELWARIDNLSADAVKNALWRDRTLVKTWALRGTLHLLTSNDFPLYVAALSSKIGEFYRRPSWLKYNDVTLIELETIVDGVRAILTDVGMTRQELANALASHVGKPNLRDRLLSGWGSLLKPAAVKGYLAFGPNEGQNVTFVQPEKWIGTWTPVESDEALKEIARRYLTAYGPATIDDFARWFGMDPAKAKRIFKALADEIVEVDVEGWKAWALASLVKQMEAAEPAHVVRLLPNFDPYTVALSHQCQYLVPEGFNGRVYRPQGWISPVVLVDGHMVGVWEYDKKRSQVEVKVSMFAAPLTAIKQGIEVEAERIGTFFGMAAKLEIVSG